MEGFHERFTFNELTATQRTHLQAANRVEAMKFIEAGKRLSQLLGRIREGYGAPIRITSGFRSLELNIAVGSRATRSAHLRFEAADGMPVGRDFRDLFAWLIRNRGDFPELRQAIIEHHKGIVHIEVRMNPADPQRFLTTTDNITFTPSVLT